MHKGVIILVKANDRYDAYKNTVEFLESYQDTVWDWYQIGGRWSRTLNPLNKQFDAKARTFCLMKQKQKGITRA